MKLFSNLFRKIFEQKVLEKYSILHNFLNVDLHFLKKCGFFY